MAINSNSNIYGVGVIKNPNNLTKRSIDKLFGLRFPMGDVDSGTYLKKSSGLNAVKSHLRQLLLTNRGERVMLPAYGTNLRRYLMEPLDQATLSSIKREIFESIRRYAPNVSLDKIQVFPGRTETLEGGHFITIKLFCTLLDEDNINFDINVEIR